MMLLAVVKSSFSDMHDKITSDKIQLKPFSDLLLLKSDIDEKKKEKERSEQKSKEIIETSDDINDLEYTKDVYSYSTVNDFTILQNMDAEEIWLLKDKVEKNNKWLKEMETKKGKSLRKSQSIGIPKIDYKYEIFMKNEIDLSDKNLKYCKMGTLDFFRKLNIIGKKDIEENCKNTYGVAENAEEDKIGQKRKSTNLAKNIIKVLNEAHKSFSDIVDSDASISINHESDDSDKITRDFKRKTIYLSNILMNQKEDKFTNRFVHNPWELQTNCDDIDFSNKFQLSAKKRRFFNKRREKSIPKNSYKYQRVTIKALNELNKTEIRERNEKSKYNLITINHLIGEKIEPQMKSFKEYSNYIYSMINNDYEIKDEFNIDQNKPEVLK